MYQKILEVVLFTVCILPGVYFGVNAKGKVFYRILFSIVWSLVVIFIGYFMIFIDTSDLQLGGTLILSLLDFFCLLILGIIINYHLRKRH